MKLLKQANWLFLNKNFLFKLKKKAVITAFFFLISFYSNSQNLVSNSGFDTLSQCPYTGGQINFAPNWFQPIRQVSTSDLYNICNGGGWVFVPINILGHQSPLSDSGYAGIGIYTADYPNGREYIETKLSSTLKKGYTYCVEFYFSLADTQNYAVSSIGAYFSIDSVLIDNLPNNYLINVIPQIQNDSSNIITDKVNWVIVKDSFIANGGEQFITIGNFYDDNFTQRHYQKVSNHNVTSWNDGAYYYIDNVSVYACDSPLVEEPQDTTFVFIPNVFSPKQDGENDFWQVTANKVNNLNVQVFNRWGEQVYKTNLANTEEPTNFNPAWDGYTPTGKTVPEGTYFYIVQYTLPSGEVKVEKGNLTLLR